MEIPPETYRGGVGAVKKRKRSAPARGRLFTFRPSRARLSIHLPFPFGNASLAAASGTAGGAVGASSGASGRTKRRFLACGIGTEARPFSKDFKCWEHRAPASPASWAAGGLLWRAREEKGLGGGRKLLCPGGRTGKRRPTPAIWKARIRPSKEAGVGGAREAEVPWRAEQEAFQTIGGVAAAPGKKRGMLSSSPTLGESNGDSVTGKAESSSGCVCGVETFP